MADAGVIEKSPCHGVPVTALGNQDNEFCKTAKATRASIGAENAKAHVAKMRQMAGKWIDGETVQNRDASR